MDAYTPEFLERRRRAMEQYAEAWKGVDDLDPQSSVGHAYGVRNSAWPTQDQLPAPHREKRQYNAGDFRRLVRVNHDRIRRQELRRLAAEVWEGAGDDIERLMRITLSDAPPPL